MAASPASSATSVGDDISSPMQVATPESITMLPNELRATGEAPIQVTNSAREPTQRWKHAELRLLISLKRNEYEQSLSDTPRDRIKTADTRWKKVTEGLLRYGFNRKQCLIRKKWEKLTTDFKKIYDYQKRPPSGELGYFEMGSEARRRFKLPAQFESDVYRQMECWVPCKRAVQPDPEQLVDSSVSAEPPPRVAEPPPRESEQQPSVERTPTEHTPTNNTEGDQRSTRDDNSKNSVPDHPGAQGRLLKQSKRDRLDEHFKNANAEIVKALAIQAEKKEISDKAFLDWDKEKHKFLAQIDLKKHKETVIMQEKMSGEISSALREVSASFTHFATEMSKRM